jgi:hypothetical protein
MCLRAEEPFLEKASSAVPDYRSPLKTHVDLVPPSLNCSLDGGLLRREGIAQTELSFGHVGRIMLLDGEFSAESAVLKLA